VEQVFGEEPPSIQFIPRSPIVTLVESQHRRSRPAVIVFCLGVRVMRRLLKSPFAVVAACGLMAGVLAVAHGALAAARLPAYFNPGDAAPPLVFMRQAPPPDDNIDNKTSYGYGPITDSIAQNVNAQNTSTWSGRDWPSVWANRARVPNGYVAISPNGIYPAILDSRGNPYGLEFTTYARANAATKAEVLYIMGASSLVWQAPLKAAGISAVTWDSLNANPSAYFKYRSQDGGSTVMVDKMVIPTTRSTSAYGMRIDYEVQDDRTAADAHPFLGDLGATIRRYGLKAYLYTNPWDSESTQRNGFAFSRIDDLKANFDYISILVWGGTNQCIMATSYPYSVSFLRGVSGALNFRQILLTVDLLHCTTTQAILMYRQRAIDHFSGYVMWDDNAIVGGPTLTGSNRVIYALLHGS
jgi:hypothetical protein